MKINKVLAGVLMLGVFGLVSCERTEKVEEPAKEREIQGTTKREESKEAKKEVKKESAYALADSKGCFACHGVDRKKVGPAYVEVAKRYAGKENAVEELVKSMVKGSMGKWGSIPMTPQPVSKEEAEKLARWILSLK